MEMSHYQHPILSRFSKIYGVHPSEGTAPYQLDNKLGCVVHRRLDIRAKSFGDLVSSALALYYARDEESVHTWGLTPRILSFIANFVLLSTGPNNKGP